MNNEPSEYPCPLEDAHLQLLNQVLQMEAVQQRHLANCEQCGLIVDKLRADSDRRMALATALKKQFFPNCS